MDDTLYCPVCGNKLKTNHHKKKILHAINKTANYAERVCSDGHNHIVDVWVDKATKKVDLLRLSIKYSRIFEVDYVNQKCRIVSVKDGEYQYIDIPKIIEPDFPDLEKLKERVKLYILFS